VPIDDTHPWKYNLTFRRTRVIDHEARMRGRTGATPDYHPIRQKANRYQQNRAEMTAESFAGLGRDFQAQDACATEGAGPIQDRTAEHLGYTDKGIIAARRALLNAIRAVQQGEEPAHIIRGPDQNDQSEIGARKDIVPASLHWRRYWETADADGRSPILAASVR
jgi:hypothetical protein